MYRKIMSLLMVAVLLVAVLGSITGCDSSETRPTEISNTTYPTQTVLPQPTTDPLGSSLTISQPPKLGETAELIFTIDMDYSYAFNNKDSMTNASAWVEFYWTNTQGSYSEAKQSVLVPVDEVMVSGDFSWEGNALTTRPIKLHSTIQLTREGIWEIMGYFSGEGWDDYVSRRLIIASTKNAATIWGSEEFKTGPLAYLYYFPYGKSTGHKTVNYLTSPIIVEMDISKAPRVGEEISLSCLINSLYDVADFSASIRFGKRMVDNSIVETSSSDILVEGSLEWSGNLKKGNPVEFSALVRFPAEGDWWISALGISAEDMKEKRAGYVDGIHITISDNNGYFGWESRPHILPEDYEEPGPNPYTTKKGLDESIEVP